MVIHTFNICFISVKTLRVLIHYYCLSKHSTKLLEKYKVYSFLSIIFRSTSLLLITVQHSRVHWSFVNIYINPLIHIYNIRFFFSDCPLTINNPVTIKDGLSCSIPDYCTATDVCVYIPFISRNIHAYLRLHTCDALLEVGIEQFTFSVGLFDNEFGKCHVHLILFSVVYH